MLLLRIIWFIGSELRWSSSLEIAKTGDYNASAFDLSMSPRSARLHWIITQLLNQLFCQASKYHVEQAEDTFSF